MTTKPDEYLGCLSGGCVIERPKGQHLNGSCDCLDGMNPVQRIKLRKAIARSRTRIAELEAQVTEQQRRLDKALEGWS